MKTIFVPGGSGGLGSKLVPYLSEKGYRVIYTGHAGPLDFSAANTEFLPWDMSADSTTDLLNRLKQVGAIDGWIHAVGGFWMGGDLPDTPHDKMMQQMQLNFDSAVLLTPTLTDLMSKSPYARLIFMGGLPGLYAMSGMGAYGVSKAALTHYFKVLSEELKSTSIRTTMLVPSIIDTPANRDAMPDANFDEWVSPQQIADVCNFLLTDAAKTIHNSILELI